MHPECDQPMQQLLPVRLPVHGRERLLQWSVQRGDASVPVDAAGEPRSTVTMGGAGTVPALLFSASSE